MFFSIFSNSQEKKYVNFAEKFVKTLKQSDEKELESLIISKELYLKLLNQSYSNKTPLNQEDLKEYINVERSETIYRFYKIKLACIDKKINLKDIEFISIKELSEQGEIKNKTFKIFFREANKDYYIKLNLIEEGNSVYIFNILNFNISK